MANSLATINHRNFDGPAQMLFEIHEERVSSLVVGTILRLVFFSFLFLLHPSHTHLPTFLVGIKGKNITMLGKGRERGKSTINHAGYSERQIDNRRDNIEKGRTIIKDFSVSQMSTN